MTSTVNLAVEQRNLVRGAIYVLASGLMFALGGVAVKLASHELPGEVVVFWRNLFNFVLLLPWLWYKGLDSIRTQRLPLHILRSMAGLAAIYCYFYAIRRIPLADAVLLLSTNPIFTPPIGYLFFRMPVQPKTLIAGVIGLVGVAFVVRPTVAGLSFGALSGVASGVLGGLAVVAIWRMANSEPAMRIMFYFGLFSTLVSAIPLSWSWAVPHPESWVALGAIGVFTTLAHILFAIGCTVAPADRANIWSYTSVVFAAALAWGLWGERADLLMVIGAILVTVSGTMATRATWRTDGCRADSKESPS